MIILKLTGVFEIHVHFKMIIFKREQMFFNLKGWNYNWVFRENTKSFTFKYFQKTEVYLAPIQISKMELFVEIINSLMPLTILTKSSILDVWLGSKMATKSFHKSFCKFNFLALAAIWLKTDYKIFLFSSIFKRQKPEAVVRRCSVKRCS